MPLMIMGLNWQPAQTPGVFDADRISVEMDMFAVAAVSPQVRTPERDNVIDEPNLAQQRDLSASSSGDTRTRAVSGGNVLCILGKRMAVPKSALTLPCSLGRGHLSCRPYKSPLPQNESDGRIGASGV